MLAASGVVRRAMANIYVASQSGKRKIAEETPPSSWGGVESEGGFESTIGMW